MLAEASSLDNPTLIWHISKTKHLHAIAFVIYHFRHTRLDNLDRTPQARASAGRWVRVAPEYRTLTHVLQYNVEFSPTLSRPASSNAFSSACKQRHESYASPLFAVPLHRLHPPSLQLTNPRGVPLYLNLSLVICLDIVWG